MSAISQSAGSTPELARAMEGAAEAFARGDLPEAERRYRAALALAPAHGGAWQGLAEVLAARGAASEAAAARAKANEAAVILAATTATALLGTAMAARAPAILRQALQTHPAVAVGHRALCEVLRRMGDLAGALEAARRCLELDPGDGRAARLAASLQGRRLPTPRDLAAPAPLWIVDDFLPAALHAEVLRFALAHRQALQPAATVGAAQPDWRRSQVDRTPDFAAPVLALVCREAEAAVGRFGLEPFEMASRDIQFTAHNDGDYYKAHRDWAPQTTHHRRLTFVYYLHRQPRGFAGGGLRLFDTPQEGEGFFDQAYATVLPLDNRLVVFPSYVWHEVEKIVCPGRLYEDSRFTLNGWLGVAPT
ncbi:MAG: 2OG-Fe(II) oxygenase [Reyranellaceae bacterium]